jgi:recombination DNA repair RAD52 pathway protein
MSYDRCGHEIRPLSDQQLDQLLASLKPNRVATRKQGGSTLSYLEAWDVRATLTRIFGFGGWSITESKTEVLHSGTYKKPQGGEGIEAACQSHVTLHIHQLGTWFSDVGIASQKGVDIGEVMDFAAKTSQSDALKRCAVNLGTQFGLSLYDNGNTSDVIKVILLDEQDTRKRKPSPDTPSSEPTPPAVEGGNTMKTIAAGFNPGA